jgi:hypothetical protein
MRDHLDIGIDPDEPFIESDYRTGPLAAEIFRHVPIEQRSTLTRAIRLAHESQISRPVTLLKPVLRGWQKDRRVAVFLGFGARGINPDLSGEIEDVTAGWILHESAVTITRAPTTWRTAIEVGDPLDRWMDIPILGCRTITDIRNEEEMIRLHLDYVERIPGVPHIAEPL